MNTLALIIPVLLVVWVLLRIARALERMDEVLVDPSLDEVYANLRRRLNREGGLRCQADTTANVFAPATDKGV